MLKRGVRVEVDPENSISVRLVGGVSTEGKRSLRKMLVLQVNGDQTSEEERSLDTTIIVGAINSGLSSAHLDPYPDLLAACEAALTRLEHNDATHEHRHLRRMMTSAIAKAEGDEG